jgi:hypothetical protein
MRANLALRERTDAALALQYAVVASVPMEDPVSGAMIQGALEVALDRLGVRPPASYEDLGGLNPVPVIREMLGQAAYEEALARGRRMSLEDAVDTLEGMVDRYIERVGATS